jgi:adenylate kinase
MALIIITGTPATGKSALACIISARFGYKRLNIECLVNRLSSGYDRKRQCKIVDEGVLAKELVIMIGKSRQDTVIDSHLSHYIPAKYVDLCLVTKCSLKVLKKRLEKRYANKIKVRENLDSEIFDICHNEALELGHKVVVVDTGKKVDINKLKRAIASVCLKASKSG